MALYQTTFGHLAASHPDLVRIILVVAVIALVFAMSAIVGGQHIGPSYDLVPDPAGLGLPF